MRHAFQPVARATSLAAWLVFGLSSLTAHAATPAEMQKIKLYGDVTIAQDSVQSWGPWEQFEAPAAGNQPSVPTFGSDASNLYRPIGPVTPPTPVPSNQALTGYGVFIDFATEGAPLSLTTIEATTSGATAPNTTSPATVSATFAPIITTTVPTTGTGTLAYAGTDENLLPVYANTDGTKMFKQLPALTGIDSNAIQAWPVLYAYLSGQSNENNPQPSAADSSRVGVLMYGVVGRATSSADMATLRGGNFSATYTGSSLASGQAFVMNVKFGDGTVSGSIGGPNYYRFNGGINGSNVNATFSATGGSIAKDGSLAGMFAGNQAAGFAGVYQLTTTKNVVLSDAVLAQRGALQPPVTAGR